MAKEVRTYYCLGEDCPIKDKCARLKSDVDKTKEDWLAWAPYDKLKGKCVHFDPKGQANKVD